jgi:hypothetical protein
MGKVSQAERDLFRKAVTEAFVRKFDRELADCPFSADCSETHVRRMETIMADGLKVIQRRKCKNWVVALLVAAALLLTACTVYVYRGEIRAYIERIYEERIRVTYYDADEEPEADLITEFYTLGYVPEGYVLESEQHLPVMSQTEWVNEQGDYIFFEQHRLDGFNVSMDSENGRTSVIICGEFEVYCLIAEVSTYMWNDGMYAYKIRSSEKISNDELVQIISGLHISNESSN